MSDDAHPVVRFEVDRQRQRKHAPALNWSSVLFARARLVVLRWLDGGPRRRALPTRSESSLMRRGAEQARRWFIRRAFASSLLEEFPLTVTLVCARGALTLQELVTFSSLPS